MEKMESLEQQPSNNKQPILQNISSSITANALLANKFDEIETSVGFNAKDILDRPPIAMLKKLDGMDLKLEIFVAAQISKLVESVNMNGQLNIQKYQIPVIAAQLIESYPVETLEDFVLCFKRGGAGFYGQIYRLDAAVLNEWMKQYLDEKYIYVEAQIQQQKEQTIQDNEVNYAKFKERVGDFIKAEKATNFKENEIQKQKLANPYRYYDVRGLQIYATSQEHAEKLINRMIELGEVEEVKE